MSLGFSSSGISISSKIHHSYLCLSLTPRAVCHMRVLVPAAPRLWTLQCWMDCNLARKTWAQHREQMADMRVVTSHCCRCTFQSCVVYRPFFLRKKRGRRNQKRAVLHAQFHTSASPAAFQMVTFLSHRFNSMLLGNLFLAYFHALENCVAPFQLIRVAPKWLFSRHENQSERDEVHSSQDSKTLWIKNYLFRDKAADRLALSASSRPRLLPSFFWVIH